MCSEDREMPVKWVDKAGVSDWLVELAREVEVWAPMARSAEDVVLAPFDPEKLTLDYGRLTEPVRRLFFPQRDTIFEFAEDKIEGHYDTTRRIVFGLRPCDARALALLDDFFTRNFEDPHYLSRRQNSILIVGACREPESTCFCEAAGGGPVAEAGFDLQFFDFGDYYLVPVGSEAGEKLVSERADIFKEPPRDFAHALTEFRKQASAKFAAELDMERAAELVRGSTDLEEFWQSVAARCMMCGSCAYLCPTCTCFEVYDRVAAPGKGERVRIWDSCVFAGYTREASGHNPRAEQHQRCVRRYEHKLESPQSPLCHYRCVGCGRCVDACMSGLGMTNIIKELLDWVEVQGD